MFRVILIVFIYRLFISIVVIVFFVCLCVLSDLSYCLYSTLTVAVLLTVPYCNLLTRAINVSALYVDVFTYNFMLVPLVLPYGICVVAVCVRILRAAFVAHTPDL